MLYQELDRPARNRRTLGEMDYDRDLEEALVATCDSGKAIIVPISQFHSSPAKSRLWADGYKVRHRVLPDRENVAAWVEDPILEEVQKMCQIVGPKQR